MSESMNEVNAEHRRLLDELASLGMSDVVDGSEPEDLLVLLADYRDRLIYLAERMQSGDSRNLQTSETSPTTPSQGAEERSSDWSDFDRTWHEDRAPFDAEMLFRDDDEVVYEVPTPPRVPPDLLSELTAVDEQPSVPFVIQNVATSPVNEASETPTGRPARRRPRGLPTVQAILKAPVAPPIAPQVQQTVAASAPAAFQEAPAILSMSAPPEPPKTSTISSRESFVAPLAAVAPQAPITAGMESVIAPPERTHEERCRAVAETARLLGSAARSSTGKDRFHPPLGTRANPTTPSLFSARARSAEGSWWSTLQSKLTRKTNSNPSASPESIPAQREPSAPTRRPRAIDPKQNDDAGVEVRLAVRRTTLLPVTALSVFLVGLLIWAGLDRWRATASLAQLAAILNQQPLDQEALAARLADKVESPLNRNDPSRDYLTARALDLVDAAGGDDRPHALNPANPTVFQNLKRAVERAPLNPWYRLSLFRFAKSVELETANQQEMVQALLRTARLEPLVAMAAGEGLLARGETTLALEQFSQALRYRPEQTKAVLNTLERKKIDRNTALAVVPIRPQCGLEATRWLQSKGADWRKYAESVLTQTTGDATKRTVESEAAEGVLLQMLGRSEESAKMLTRAVEKRPARWDWKLELARAHQELRQWGECDRRIEEVIAAVPNSPQAEEARRLRDRISLATGGKRNQATVASPSAN